MCTMRTRRLTPHGRAIHPTAIVDPRRASSTTASRSAPYTRDRPAREDRRRHHGRRRTCVIEGHTTIGRDNRIFQFGSIGARAAGQEVRAASRRELVIGDRNTIREFCTFNLGTVQDGGVTRIGDDNWIMAYVHVAHDCVVGNHTIFANNATLAGHVQLGDWVDRRRPHRRAPVREDRRARDGRLRERGVAGRAAVHDWSTAIRWRCAASTSRACAGAASAPERIAARQADAPAALPRRPARSRTRRRAIAALAQRCPRPRPTSRLMSDFLAARRRAASPAEPDGLHAPRFAMVAGEASGDLLAGLLLDGLRARWPELQSPAASAARGWRAHGFDAWWPHEKLAVRGYVEVLRHYREIVGIRDAARASACWPTGPTSSSASTRPTSTSASRAG